MVTPARFERAAFGLGIRCSIQLSYEVKGLVSVLCGFFEERANGFGHSLAKTKKAGLCFLDISRCVF